MSLKKSWRVNKMWTIIKFDKKRIELLKKDLKNKLNGDITFYTPQLQIEKFKNNKLSKKEYNLLGDYIFCFHNSFKKEEIMQSLKFTKGLKYFLGGFIESQKEIVNFITKCKNAENKDGYLSHNFFELELNSTYKFSSGPFTNMIFKIIDLQKNKINILLGNIKTTIGKDYLFIRV